MRSRILPLAVTAEAKVTKSRHVIVGFRKAPREHGEVVLTTRTQAGADNKGVAGWLRRDTSIVE